MAHVELNDQEWQQVLGILGEAPWKIAHPLLMKIGNQLRTQQAGTLAQSVDKLRSPTGDGEDKELAS